MAEGVRRRRLGGGHAEGCGAGCREEGRGEARHEVVVFFRARPGVPSFLVPFERALAFPALRAAATSSASDSSRCVGERVDVGHRVVVGEQAEVDLAVVAHDRDGERVVLGEERDRHDLLHLAPEQVERELRPRHVRDDQVEEPGGEVEPRGLGEQRGRREVLSPAITSAPSACFDSFRLSHALAHDPQPLDRVLRRTPAAARAWRRCGCRASPCSSSARIDTGTSARSSRPSRAHAAVVQPAPQRAGDDREHGVVHGAAEPVLDLLEVVEPALDPAHAPVRPDRHVERHVGRGVHARPDHLAERPRRPRAAARASRPGAGAAPTARPASSNGVRTRPLTPSATSSTSEGSGRGRPALVLLRLVSAGTGERSNSTVAMSTPGHAVHERVVGLRDQREAAALEALDEPHLPERLRAVETLGEDAADQLAQLLVAARRSAARCGARGSRG